jgi:hypothetical protein
MSRTIKTTLSDLPLGIIRNFTRDAGPDRIKEWTVLPISVDSDTGQVLCEVLIVGASWKENHPRFGYVDLPFLMRVSPRHAKRRRIRLPGNTPVSIFDPSED